MNRYLRFVSLLIALSSIHAFAATPKIDRVLILKKEHKLLLLSGKDTVKTYRVALGDPVGPKRYQGDRKTPEGSYVIDGRNGGSHYHKSLHISYPNAADRARAKKAGRDPGGDVFIHGLPNGQGWIGRGHTAMDWTLGCVAVTNEEIDEIWKLVPNGTVVEIRP